MPDVSEPLEHFGLNVFCVYVITHWSNKSVRSRDVRRVVVLLAPFLRAVPQRDVMKVLSVSNDSRRLKYKAARCIYTLPTVRDHPAQNLLSQKLLKPVVVRILLSL